ncbi:oligosaccharide flippase family protein [Alkalitalea saponilacus]|uniref:Membrane protein involved in the export of O-antigen and teichoic acid n=1 Tax=Alkalitalea saponilacus TaxID=889453 RepID=A0A1T5EAV7_9BACT|nr:oligosaccharide flippase family protein [Alkalitalea saponilacus]ASB49056.1 polysaccharide biosynthesis protein [Alkalitalea saponilacus]SKB80939.1 Membrane protein involved in the export of O-antigen and teichoic acid [Alkalitalea saponilacus]
MSGGLKKLASETIIYGSTTMIGRLLNWLLMPFYIRVLSPEEYGVVINFYSFISILLVIFTYGMETGFFRFSKSEKFASVYASILSSLTVSGLLLIIIITFSSDFISNILYNGQFRVSIILIGWIIAIDAFISVPFANLRLNNKAIRFGIIRLSGIFSNIFFNLFFLLLIPYLIKIEIIGKPYANYFESCTGVFYILLSNLISSLLMFSFFITEIFRLKGTFDKSIILGILNYSWPFIIVGITGMIIQNSDKILIPILRSDGFNELAVYAANFKIGILMTLFTQSFRFAFEPYFFKNRDKGLSSYALIMDYFIAFGLFIFLGVTIFQDLINILLTKEYLYGNIVIPVVLMAQLFYGIYFNLSLWYKLTDRTYFGAIFGILGTIITLTLNFITIPIFGMIGAAYSMLFGYGLMALFSALYGNKYFPVPYPLKRILLYFVAALVLYIINKLVDIDFYLFRYLFKITILFVFIAIFVLLQGKSGIKILES